MASRRTGQRYVGYVRWWMMSERVELGKTRDDAPSPQEEDKRERAEATLGFETRIAEAYAALEAMLKDGERMRLQSEAEGENLPFEMAEDRYNGTMGEGAEQDALLDNGERTSKDKAETPVAGPSARVRPRVTDGGGGKVGDHDDDVGEGAEQATLSPCGTEDDHG